MKTVAFKQTLCLKCILFEEHFLMKIMNTQSIEQVQMNTETCIFDQSLIPTLQKLFLWQEMNIPKRS